MIGRGGWRGTVVIAGVDSFESDSDDDELLIGSKAGLGRSRPGSHEGVHVAEGGPSLLTVELG